MRGESARKSSKVSKVVCVLFIYDMFFSYPITICLATGVQDLALGYKGAIAEAIPAGALTRQVFQNSREGTGVLREGVAAGQNTRVSSTYAIRLRIAHCSSRKKENGGPEDPEVM